MKLTYLDYADLPFVASRDLHYIQKDPSLKPFYTYPPDLDQFAHIIEQRQKHPVDRNLLVSTLQQQYRHRESQPLVMERIESLRSPQAFTVITAHQPSLFTGPLYYIYKILSCIRLSQLIQANHPEYRIIPLFILGGEDHDFAEINHLHIGDRTIRWDHPSIGGSCGRLSTEGIDQCIEAVATLLGDGTQQETLMHTLRQCYLGSHNYAEATIRFLHHLFGRFGLVILNMDHSGFKMAFRKVMLDDLLQHSSSRLVPPVQKQLEDAGFPAQAFVRDINLFYFNGNQRERIEQEGEEFILVDSLIRFSKSAMIKELEDHPERFSPNVILRPLYQETILPNLAYIGGGGELAYWLERKEQFEHYHLPFPMLVRRNSAAWLDQHAQSSLRKAGRPLQDYFTENPDDLIRDFIQDSAAIDLDYARRQIDDLFARIQTEGEAIDARLQFPIEGVRVRIEKYLNNLEHKMIRAEKRKQEPSISRLLHNYHILFPNGTLQERYTNFLPYYAKNGPGWLDELLPYFNPLDHRFLLFEE
ncbi:MAG: bacillithiol biosynthesis cysteine-adding enzyme BshC [Saprospiraceae bacterium]